MVSVNNEVHPLGVDAVMHRCTLGRRKDKAWYMPHNGRVGLAISLVFSRLPPRTNTRDAIEAAIALGFSEGSVNSCWGDWCAFNSSLFLAGKKPLGLCFNPTGESGIDYEQVLARYGNESESQESWTKSFGNSVAISRGDSSELRQSRLASADKKPRTLTVLTQVFSRNPDVVVAALERAQGVCEECGLPAPFVRASDGSPYLEVHHVVRLADGGDDSVENALAVCPNCHRKLHFG